MTSRGFKRVRIPPESGSSGKWCPNPDAVKMLLEAFGYPTIAPTTKKQQPTFKFQLLDDEENDDG
jgi:hypothetical protein